MTAPLRSRGRRPPLDARKLDELALRYVGRYATTRARLVGYLTRKLRERGWRDAAEPDVESLASRFCKLGYVDDAAYALAKSRALSSRGYGKRRLVEKLRVAGIREEDAAAAREHADSEALHAAIRFAERRKIGPFGSGKHDPKQREKEIAAMVRAGHAFSLAKAIACWPFNAEIDLAEIADRAGIGLGESRFPDTNTSVNGGAW